QTWPLPIAILIIGFGPAIGEELWCRGFLGRGLVGNYGPVAGAFLTSFLFGLIHIEPRQAMVAMLMGLVLHYTYLMTRSLLVPMLLHLLNNSLAVTASHVHFFDFLDAPEMLAPPVYLAAGLLLLAVCWTLY